MWQPTFQQNITDLGVRHDCSSFRQQYISDEKINPDVDLCEKSDRMECSDSFRHLWVWIHASAFEEGYDNLKLACQKEVHFLLLILIWITQLYFVSIVFLVLGTDENK